MTAGLADFVSLPGLLWDNMSARDISVRVAVWACQHLLVRVCTSACVCVHGCADLWLRICLQPGLEEVSRAIVEFQLERKKALYERAPCGSESPLDCVTWLE